jgi:oxygen-dependent protoporphyrinogen oxidase
MIHQEKRQEREYAGIILATPAPITAKLVESLSPHLAHSLKHICYYPVALIVAEYNRNIFSEQVRSLAFDASAPISNAAAYGVNSLHIVRYTFSGRTARRYLKSGMDTEEMIQIAEATLRKYIPVQSTERVQFVAKQYHTGLCAYTPHYAQFSQSIQSWQGSQGIYITGDYIQGASIEGCFRAAKVCVEKVLHNHSTLPEVERVQATTTSTS